MMTEEKLKPCPYCGSTGIAEIHETADATVYCARCFGEIKLFRRGIISQKLNVGWNTRPLESALEARVKELEAENERLKTIAQAYAEKLNTAIATAPAYKAALEAITLGQAELVKARAAAENLIRHIEAVECVACPYRRDRCSMGHDEPCYTRIKDWAYAPQEAEE